MPITAWDCPECHRAAPLDHYESGGACSLAVHPDYVAAVLADSAKRADKAWPTVTMGLGCVRAAAIQQDEDVSINPLDVNAMLTGSAWHAVMDRGAPDNEVEVSGQLGGMVVTGTIDRVRKLADGRVIIEDWKHGNCFSRKYATAAKPEHVVQVSLYAELYAQMYDIKPSAGVVWYHYTSSPALIPRAVELWNVERCLAHHPYDADWTVGQLLRLADDYDNRCVPAKWQDLPLVGATIKFGNKTGCEYCSVRAICMTAATGAPF